MTPGHSNVQNLFPLLLAALILLGPLALLVLIYLVGDAVHAQEGSAKTG